MEAKLDMVLEQVGRDKNIDKTVLISALEQAILTAAKRIVRPRELVEAEHEHATERTLGGICGPERRLRIAVVEVLVDHRGLGEHERVLLEDRHAAERVLLVDPRRPVVEVDLYRFVLDSLFRERDPDARAVRATIGVVERDHRSILASRPSTSAI